MEDNIPTLELDRHKFDCRDSYFSQFTHYCCRTCNDACINRLDEACTKYGECRDCFSLPCPASDSTAAATDDGGTSIPSDRECPSRSAERENTAFLGDREVSGKAAELLKNWPRAPAAREVSDGD